MTVSLSQCLASRVVVQIETSPGRLCGLSAMQTVEYSRCGCRGRYGAKVIRSLHLAIVCSCSCSYSKVLARVRLRWHSRHRSVKVLGGMRVSLALVEAVVLVLRLAGNMVQNLFKLAEAPSEVINVRCHEGDNLEVRQCATLLLPLEFTNCLVARA